ncbi:MAG: hypothetical protein NZL92_11020, partial [Gloeomargarita sp. SKYG116]|nr:hypothetical protein [Gloeomargarita sp. SKYG116]MDW8402214.1 hypothetical protein [Gloeomargarita sp. SKYGB_i_bin116]
MAHKYSSSSRRWGRTPLFRCVQRWLNAATLTPDQFERAWERRSRRRFLRTAGAFATGALA